MQPVRTLDPGYVFGQRGSFSKSVEQLPLTPLTRVDFGLEVGVRPVAELVGIQPLQLEAYPVGYLEGIVGKGTRVLPVETFDEGVLRGVAPARARRAGVRDPRTQPDRF